MSAPSENRLQNGFQQIILSVRWRKVFKEKEKH